MLGRSLLPHQATANIYVFSNKAEENEGFTEWLPGKGGYLEKGLKGGWIGKALMEMTGCLGEFKVGLDKLFAGVSGESLLVSNGMSSSVRKDPPSYWPRSNNVSYDR